MATAEHSFRAGDTVKHHPTGETWHLAAVNKTCVLPSGWPETIAYAVDCELVMAATDEEHEQEVRQWADVYKHIPYDCRAQENWRIIERRHEAECKQMERV